MCGMKKTIFTSLLVLIGLTAFAQTGLLRGTIIDKQYGEPAINALIKVEGTSIQGLTDFDGNYSVTVPVGTYTVRVSSFGYSDFVVSGVTISEGKVTIQDGVLESASEVIGEITITAQASRNSEAGIMIQRKNASNVMDGLSSQSFRRVGDGNLSAAIGRVTGVSVQDGKYVYVRGLGDRYTKTTLNGMTIPGLDPDKNAVQIDIFPTKTLENVMIYKTFSSNLYGDFTGGLVNVETKSFPEHATTQLSVGATYIPSMHFNNNFILYDGGSFDWAGFDDGGRAFPMSKFEQVPAAPNATSTELTRGFGKQMAAQSATALPNMSISFNTGDQINAESGRTYGYNFVVNYQLQNTFYEDYESNTYLKPIGNTATELFRDERRIGALGQRTAQWSALGSGAMKWNTNSLELLVLHSQSGESSAAQRTAQNYNQTGATLLEDILTYSQRSLTTAMVIGKHKVGDWNLEWNNAFTKSRVYDPDFRTTSISITGGDTSLSVGNGAGINRFWRDLNEWNESARLDLSKNWGETGKVSFGGVVVLKSRDFEILNTNFRRGNTSDININPDWFFEDENIYSSSNTDGTYVRYNYEASNSFTSGQQVYAGYVQNEHNVLLRLKLIYGLRVEQAMMTYTGETQPGPSYEVYDRTETLNELNFLPSFAAIYDLNESMKLRASYGRTLARPSFKEKSAAQIFDPISKRTFIGNLDLEQTTVNNFDLRYEWFFEGADVFAVSGFYKTFTNHIEMVSYQTAPDNLSPRNAGSSTVFGAEIELSKSLSSLGGFFEKLKVGGNFSYVESRVDLHSVIVDDNGTTEYELRQQYLRDGETLKDYRSMAGQAPYTFNFNLNYGDPETGTNVSVAYNVQGTFLAIVGSGRVPDVYTVPFNSLNVNAYKDFGSERQHRITLGVQNALDGERHNIYRSYGAEDVTYSRYKPGVGVTVKYSYTF